MATNYNPLGKDNTTAATALDPLKGFKVAVTPILDLRGKAINDTFTAFYLPKGAQILTMAIEVVENANLAAATVDIGAQTINNGVLTTTVGQEYVAGASVKQTAGTLVACDGVSLITGAGIQQAIAVPDAAFAVGVKLASTTGSAALTAGQIRVHIGYVQL